MGVSNGRSARQLDELARRCGIVEKYTDIFGRERPTSPEVRDALLRAMGIDPEDPPELPAAPIHVVTAGQSPELGAGALVLEDGRELPVDGKLPRDVPPGYHAFYGRSPGEPQTVIVCPGQCWFDSGMRQWGWAVPLYATRSHASWGIGDLGDLREVANWSASLGADLLLLNPLGAADPYLPQQASPYYPSSRLYRNPIYLRIEEIPGAEDLEEIELLAAVGRDLNHDQRIDRDRVFSIKMRALEAIWRAGDGEPEGLQEYVAAEGERLERFATYCVLAEHFSVPWPKWPAEFRRPDNPAVARFGREHQRRVRFHQWIQWLLDEQLRRSAEALPLVNDLPIGSDPTGADAWAWQDVMALGVKIGAPPDQFNTTGQDWGLPPFIPYRLRQARYAPFIQMIRAVMRHAVGLRLDHVMGLFRQYWIPPHGDAVRGTYVRFPAEELLGILALESQRHGCWVAGEDLGTVEAGVRETMARYRILSHRLVIFEDEPPESYPPLTLAAVTTHDLPTIAGLWSGADWRAQVVLGRSDDPSGDQLMRRRLARVAEVPEGSSPEEAILGVHRALAAAPSAVLIVNLADAARVQQRLNMPGTIDTWPNWSLALPLTLEQLQKDPLPRVLARMMARR